MSPQPYMALCSAVIRNQHISLRTLSGRFRSHPQSHAHPMLTSPQSVQTACSQSRSQPQSVRSHAAVMSKCKRFTHSNRKAGQQMMILNFKKLRWIAQHSPVTKFSRKCFFKLKTQFLLKMIAEDYTAMLKFLTPDKKFCEAVSARFTACILKPKSAKKT